MSYWKAKVEISYHHTLINALYGLHEALLILKEIGIENSWKKHMDNHLLLRNGPRGTRNRVSGKKGR